MHNTDVPVYTAKLPMLVARDGLRVREDVLYTNAKGEDHEASRQRAEAALIKVKDILPSVLEPSEAIFYIFKCQAPLSPFE